MFNNLQIVKGKKMFGKDKAFPSGTKPEDFKHAGEAFECGLTVRDYVAIKAMAAIISHPGMEPDDCSRTGVAELAYEFADAFIATSGREVGDA